MGGVEIQRVACLRNGCPSTAKVLNSNGELRVGLAIIHTQLAYHDTRHRVYSMVHQGTNLSLFVMCRGHSSEGVQPMARACSKTNGKSSARALLPVGGSLPG